MTDIIKVPEKEIEKYGEGAVSLINQAQSISVTNEAEAEQASLFLTKAGDKIKELEAQRTGLVKPFNDGVKAINDMFKKYTAPLTEAKNIVGAKILSWKRAEDEKIKKEEARRQAIQKAHEDKGHKVNAPIELQMTPKKIGLAQTRKVWTFELVDFSKVPDQYKELCQTAINQAIREGAREIAGLRIFEEERIGSASIR